MITIDADDVRRLRMISLLLAERSERRPGEVVEWMGAMQAQDLASGEWSFGVRCAGLTQADIHQATLDRSIVRTWPMRGTVHFVPPRDARWMLEVVGTRALAGAQRRREYLGLTEEIVNRATEVLRHALAGGKRLTRAECVEHLVAAGLHTASEHGYHLLWYASQVGVTCIGPQLGKEQTFVLLDEWVPDPRRLDRDEALAELAIRYFRSHGPTTVKDFAGWTGLNLGEARTAIALARDALVAAQADGVAMVMSNELLDTAANVAHRSGNAPDVLLLPGFDEYLLGFKDRSAMITPERMKRVIPGGNGVFMPTIVEDGAVIGTWKRQVKRDRVDIIATPFEVLTATQHRGLQRAAHEYAAYLGTAANLLVAGQSDSGSSGSTAPSRSSRAAHSRSGSIEKT